MFLLFSYCCVCLCTQTGTGGMIQMLLMIHATKPTMIRHMAGTMTLMVTEVTITNNFKTGTLIHPYNNFFVYLLTHL